MLMFMITKTPHKSGLELLLQGRRASKMKALTFLDVAYDPTFCDGADEAHSLMDSADPMVIAQDQKRAVGSKWLLPPWECLIPGNVRTDGVSREGNQQCTTIELRSAQLVNIRSLEN